MTDAPTVQDLLAQGQAHALEGRVVEAEVLLRQALERSRGTGTLEESRACGNLGSLFGMTSRRFEAILLYRRGLAIGRELGLPRLEALHLANLASMLVVLGLWANLPDVLSSLEEAAERMPEDAREAMRDLALWPRASLALHNGDVESARRLCAHFCDATEDRGDALASVSRVALRVDLLRKEGRAAEALETLAAYEPPGDAAPLDTLYLTCLRVECLEALGREDERRAEALRALDTLELAVAHADIGELSIELASDLARCLEGDPAQAEGARRAYDLAASAVLSRIATLDASAGAVPELGDLSEADRAWIADLRAAWQRDQQALLERVGVLLREQATDRAAFLYAGGPAGTLLRLCAWCGRIGTRSGAWLPLAHFIPEDGSTRVTHGICPACSDRVREDAPPA